MSRGHRPAGRLCHLAGAGIRLDVGADGEGMRALVAPTDTRGMWIEFRENR